MNFADSGAFACLAAVAFGHCPLIGPLFTAQPYCAMRKIVYYVATSVDGFIAGPGGDISGFAQQGPGVEKYQQDLQQFDTVIMGHRTYEFGYQYGLPPGQPAYPHMEHYLFSSTLTFEHAHEKVHVLPPDLAHLMALKEQSGSDIYLCGGGELAGWLLDQRQIDVLKIKLNPVILGEGIRLFCPSSVKCQLTLTEQETFTDGPQILTYDVVYE